ncbi:hypothetical protein MRX96_030771 [Rhipicephalus microplus]
MVNGQKEDDAESEEEFEDDETIGDDQRGDDDDNGTIPGAEHYGEDGNDPEEDKLNDKTSGKEDEGGTSTERDCSTAKNKMDKSVSSTGEPSGVSRNF